MQSDDVVVTQSASTSQLTNFRSLAMAWIGFAAILAAMLCFAAFIAYQHYLRAPSRNVINVNVDSGQARHVLHLENGYLKDVDSPTRERVVLYAAYPSMLPCARNEVPNNICMHILIAPDRKRTQGEFIVEQWQSRKDRTDNGPAFDRLVGEEDGYQVYEGIVSPKTGGTVRTRIFVDGNGNFVSDGYYADARFFSGIPVRYGAAKGYRTTPKEMHKWVGNLLNKLSQENKQQERK